MTLAQILATIKGGLNSRNALGLKHKHIVITWDEAQYLHDHVIALIIERDGLLFDLEKSRKEADGLWDHITKIYLALKPDTPNTMPPPPVREQTTICPKTLVQCVHTTMCTGLQGCWLQPPPPK